MDSHRTINGREIVDDLRAGKSDRDLMGKYDLSERQLKTVLGKLIDSKLVTTGELYKLSAMYRQCVDNFRPRRAPRIEMTMPVWINDLRQSRQILLRDMSILGLRVAGDYKAGDAVSFELPVDMWMASDPVRFCAECVWSEGRGRRTTYRVAGFKITEISGRDRKTLQQFLYMIVLRDSGHWKIPHQKDRPG